MKCDEEKPACLNCRSTGRTCDGYAVEEQKSTGLVPLASSIVKNPSLWTLTDFERRGLEYFHHAVGLQLTKSLNLTASYQLILQTTHSHDTIRHATVALGLLGERLMRNQMLTFGHLEREPSYEYAQLQYTKALQQLRGTLGKTQEPPVELILLSCFLFTIFEFFQGNDVASMTHLRSGLNILRRYFDVTQNDPLIIDFFRIFSIMDSQATRWLSLPSFQSPLLLSEDMAQDPPAKYEYFDTLREAADSLTFQLDRAQMFRHSIHRDAWETFKGQIPPNIWMDRERLLIQLRKWPIATDCLESRLPSSPEATMRIAIMKMNYLSTLVILSTFLQQDSREQLVIFTPAFAQILTLAKAVLHPATQANRLRLLQSVADISREDSADSMALFSFVAGAIQPLYFTATQCQDPAMCVEALQLLRQEPWKEGAWDSEALGRIAARKLEIRLQEEAGYWQQHMSQMIGCPKFLMSLGIHPIQSMGEHGQIAGDAR